MKFSTRQDIDAPADFVFAQMSDFDGLERQAMRRGYDVRRQSDSPRSGVGTSWDLRLQFRGKLRELTAKITTFDVDNQLTATAKSSGIDIDVDVELMPLSATRTRVIFGCEIRPQSLSTRILVQSIKLAKASLQRRYERRVGKFCAIIEGRYDAK